MLSGIDGARGVGYGGAPDVRYMVVARGSSSMAGILSSSLFFPIGTHWIRASLSERKSWNYNLYLLSQPGSGRN